MSLYDTEPKNNPAEYMVEKVTKNVVTMVSVTSANGRVVNIPKKKRITKRVLVKAEK